ncbi:MAG TPA: type II secretion system protein [Acidimicrobiales bacterium]|jgi:type IV pilus assembly protein PilA
MLHELADRRRGAGDGREDGFTLIELMVVVLIIAILIAIAIPTFLGARQKAQDRAAQSDLRNALTAVKTAYVDSQSYTTDQTATAWASVEPSLTWTTGASKSAGQISTDATADDTVVLGNYSASGKCWYIKDVTGATGGDTAGTFYVSGPATSGACTASSAPTFPTTPTDPANHW